MKFRNFDQEPPPNREERRRLERMLRSNKRIKRSVIFSPTKQKDEKR